MRNMTKRRRALMASSSSQHGRLPVGFREVEWLQGSGTQYCVTDIYPTSTNQNTYTSIRGDITVLNKTTSKFGIQTYWFQSNNVYNYGFYCGYVKSITQQGEAYHTSFIFRFGPNSANNSRNFDNEVFPLDLHYELNRESTTIDNYTLAKYQYMYTATNPLVIGGNYNTSYVVTPYNENTRCKSFKIYNVDTLLYEFVPCYRTSDHKTGFMKITVADGSTEFFPNLGEDEWIIGPVV